MAFRLYTYWRSSAAFRVRIALALKGLEYESVPKHLLRDGGEQRKPDYLAVNPQGLIPALADDDFVIPQSLAICEYLEEIHPEPQLLPGSARDRATVRGMAMVVACDTHPLNNLPIMGYLRREFGADDAAGVGELLAAITVEVGQQRFCLGNTPTLADVCLVPQMYNARRFSVDVAPYPRLAAICAHLEGLPAFRSARPEEQPDAEGK